MVGDGPALHGAACSICLDARRSQLPQATRPTLPRWALPRPRVLAFLAGVVSCMLASLAAITTSSRCSSSATAIRRGVIGFLLGLGRRRRDRGVPARRPAGARGSRCARSCSSRSARLRYAGRRLVAFRNGRRSCSSRRRCTWRASASSTCASGRAGRRRCSRPAAAARGQALVGSSAMAPAASRRLLGSGWLWDHVGPAAPYYAGAIGVTCGLVAAAIGLQRRAAARAAYVQLTRGSIMAGEWNVAVVGATGLVGEAIVAALTEHEFPAEIARAARERPLDRTHRRIRSRTAAGRRRLDLRLLGRGPCAVRRRRGGGGCTCARAVVAAVGDRHELALPWRSGRAAGRAGGQPASAGRRATESSRFPRRP